MTSQGPEESASEQEKPSTSNTISRGPEESASEQEKPSTSNTIPRGPEESASEQEKPSTSNTIPRGPEETGDWLAELMERGEFIRELYLPSFKPLPNQDLPTFYPMMIPPTPLSRFVDKLDMVEINKLRKTDKKTYDLIMDQRFHSMKGYEAEVKVYRAIERLKLYEKLLVLHSLEYTKSDFQFFTGMEKDGECDFLIIGEHFFVIIEVKKNATHKIKAGDQADRTKQFIEGIFGKMCENSNSPCIMKYTAFPYDKKQSRCAPTDIFAEDLESDEKFTEWWKSNVVIDSDNKRSEVYKKSRDVLLALWASNINKENKTSEACSLDWNVKSIDKKLKKGLITFVPKEGIDPKTRNPRVVEAPEAIRKYLGVQFLTTEQNNVYKKIEDSCYNELLWINAPAGSGKTLLMAGNVIQSTKQKTSWPIIVFKSIGADWDDTDYEESDEPVDTDSDWSDDSDSETDLEQFILKDDLTDYEKYRLNGGIYAKACQRARIKYKVLNLTDEYWYSAIDFDPDYMEMTESFLKTVVKNTITIVGFKNGHALNNLLKKVFMALNKVGLQEINSVTIVIDDLNDMLPIIYRGRNSIIEDLFKHLKTLSIYYKVLVASDMAQMSQTWINQENGANKALNLLNEFMTGNNISLTLETNLRNTCDISNVLTVVRNMFLENAPAEIDMDLEKILPKQKTGHFIRGPLPTIHVFKKYDFLQIYKVIESEMQDLSVDAILHYGNDFNNALEYPLIHPDDSDYEEFSRTDVSSIRRLLNYSDKVCCDHEITSEEWPTVLILLNVRKEKQTTLRKLYSSMSRARIHFILFLAPLEKENLKDIEYMDVLLERLDPFSRVIRH
ncbi:hypothetical protein ACHWQZ_G004420 [Mnemiopsis leidyi]